MATDIRKTDETHTICVPLRLAVAIAMVLKSLEHIDHGEVHIIVVNGNAARVRTISSEIVA